MFHVVGRESKLVSGLGNYLAARGWDWGTACGHALGNSVKAVAKPTVVEPMDLRFNFGLHLCLEQIRLVPPEIPMRMLDTVVLSEFLFPVPNANPCVCGTEELGKRVGHLWWD